MLFHNVMSQQLVFTNVISQLILLQGWMKVYLEHVLTHWLASALWQDIEHVQATSKSLQKHVSLLIWSKHNLQSTWTLKKGFWNATKQIQHEPWKRFFALVQHKCNMNLEKGCNPYYIITSAQTFKKWLPTLQNQVNKNTYCKGEPMLHRCWVLRLVTINKQVH